MSKTSTLSLQKQPGKSVNKLIAALLLLAGLFSRQAFAQVDLKVVIAEPAAGITIANTHPYHGKFWIINNGPSAINPNRDISISTYIITGSATDTIAALTFIATSASLGRNTFNPGDTLTVSYGLNYNTFTQSFPNARYCHTVTLSGNTDPIPSDNTSCTNVNLLYRTPGTGGHNGSMPAYLFFGNGSTEMPFPLANPVTNKAQFLYRHDQLKDLNNAVSPSGTITKLYLRTEVGGSVRDMANVTIKLSQTAATEFTDYLFLPGTEVFNQNYYSVTASGWVEFPLSAPFNYDNTKNLLVEITGSGDGFSLMYDKTYQDRWLSAPKAALRGDRPNGLPDFGLDINSSTSVSAMQTAQAVVFPNPASTMIIISASSQLKGTFQLTDLQGRTILEQSLKLETTTMSTEMLPSGSYFYRIMDDKRTLRNGIIVIQH